MTTNPRAQSLAWLSDCRQDLSYALRTLRRTPGFAVAAVLTLALGIGAAATISSLVDAILLRPLPFTDSDRLVRLVEHMPHVVPGRAPLERGLGYPEFLEWRERSRTLSDLAAITWVGGAFRTSDGTVRLSGAMVSTNLFAMLGTRPMLGRTLEPADEVNADVIVLGHQAWRRRFHSDPQVVGTTLELRLPEHPDGRLVTIVGVLAADFEFPIGAGTDYFRPMLRDEAFRRYSADVIARVKPGVSISVAADEANAIGSVFPPRRADGPALTIPRFSVHVLKDRIVQGLRPALRVFLAAVALVLLIVCANVANLLLARGTTRRREIAVRVAMGATRGRIARQVLAECALLAGAGGALGAAIAAAGVTLVRALASVDAPGVFRFAFPSSLLPRVHEISVDFRILGIALGIAALTTVIFSIAPAMQLSRTSHREAMGTRGAGTGRRESRVRGALVVGQLAMATVLLVCAGVLTRSFVRLSAVDRGYDPSHVLVLQLQFPLDYSIPRKTAAIEAILARLRAAPAIVAAGFTRAGMLIPEEIFVGTFAPPGRTAAEMQLDPARPRQRPVSPGFLTAMGVPVLDGRDVAPSDADAATPAIVISRSVARRFFGGERAVERVVDWHVSDTLAVQARVVGVVEDIRNESADREPTPDIFVDYRQLLPLLQQAAMPAARQDTTALGFLSFAIRTAGDPAALASSVRQIVRGVDGNAGIDVILPMAQLVSNSVARQRFYAVVVGIFAVVAGLLAAIGIYGVLAYAVTERTQEIGVRMALGARRGAVLSMVLAGGLRLTLLGIALGLAGAAGVSRLLRGLLFGVAPLDATPFVVVAASFTLMAAAASYFPARRATRVDPVVALRSE